MRDDPLRDVSRETLEKLQELERLAKVWTSKINLVSKGTLGEFWSRHIVDSAQLFEISQEPEDWCDLGSGGGFPGLVLCVMQADRLTSANMTLVESDKRKCAFLMKASQELGLNCSVVPKRIEEATAPLTKTLSARALTNLSDLLAFTPKLLQKTGVAIFPKGKNWRNEVKDAEDKWRFEMDVVQSITDPEAVILRIKNIEQK